jgi:hypothetical protein
LHIPVAKRSNLTSAPQRHEANREAVLISDQYDALENHAKLVSKQEEAVKDQAILFLQQQVENPENSFFKKKTAHIGKGDSGKTNASKGSTARTEPKAKVQAKPIPAKTTSTKASISPVAKLQTAAAKSDVPKPKHSLLPSNQVKAQVAKPTTITVKTTTVKAQAQTVKPMTSKAQAQPVKQAITTVKTNTPTIQAKPQMSKFTANAQSQAVNTMASTKNSLVTDCLLANKIWQKMGQVSTLPMNCCSTNGILCSNNRITQM